MLCVLACDALDCLIVLQVVRFPEAVEAAVEELMPNRITDYLYDLSEKFNGFYTECHVSLQALCSATECSHSIHTVHRVMHMVANVAQLG